LGLLCLLVFVSLRVLFSQTFFPRKNNLSYFSLAFIEAKIDDFLRLYFMAAIE